MARTVNIEVVLTRKKSDKKFTKPGVGSELEAHAFVTAVHAAAAPDMFHCSSGSS